ncbi:MAG: S-layer homology domain-containing protein, partial [Clostridia bacterium]|nr:S-layer homology domain-containing protein [Clostridia bacterium]
TIDLNGKTMSFAASKNNSGILVDNTNSLITFKDGTINLDSVVADDSIFRNFGDGSANTVFDNVKITGKGFNVCYVFNAEVGKISFINNTTVNLRLPAGDNPQIIFCTQLNGTIVIHNADIYVDLNEIDAPVFVNCIVDIKSSNIDIKNAGYAMRLVKGSISDGSSVTVTGTENGIVNYYENDDGTELILDLPIAISNGSVVDVKSCITDVKIGTSAPITITNNSLLIADNVSVGENLLDPNFELFINGHKVSGDSMTIKFTDACWYKFMVKTNTGNVLYTVNGSPVENTLFIKEGIYNIEYTVINNNISHFGTFVLTIVKNIQVDEVPFKYTLTFVTNGGSSVNDASIIAGTKVDLSKYLTTREGYTFDGWYRDVTLTKKADKITLNQDTTVYAGWTAIKPVASDYIPKVFTKEHIAYILGTPDGKINPTDDLTRAEAAAIFFRLLDDDVRNSGLSKENKFDDVNIGDWYNEAVSTLTNLKILNGRSNSKFAPNEKIKRCEFVSIIARLIDISYSGDTIFSDIEGHWAEEHINIAAYLGWVKGNNGKFRPDNSISRAEAMAIINRSLDRKPASINDLIPTMKVWIDNTDKNAWYYLDVAEATNSHSFRNKADGTGETWTAIK